MASKRPAGARYPHATTEAKEHDHRWCPVVGAIAQRAADGREQWGIRHDMPPVPDEATALEIKRGFYRARNCRELRKQGLPVLSVQAGYDTHPDSSCVVWLRVFRREDAKREITRRVADGERLAYNTLRRP